MYTHKTVNGINVPLTKEEISEFEENDRLHLLEKEEQKRTHYKILRRKEYGSLDSQLEMIHDDFEGWKKHIQKCKDKFPKP